MSAELGASQYDIDITEATCGAAGHDHHEVRIPADMRNESITLFNEDEVDTADNRDREEAEYHAKVGKLAELVAVRFFESQGVPVQFSESWQTDLHLGEDGAVDVDVKVRDRNKTHGSDLLVRDRENVGLNSDVYLQIILEDCLTNAVITGYATREEVSSAPWFDKALSWQTRIVEEAELNDIKQLIERTRSD